MLFRLVLCASLISSCSDDAAGSEDAGAGDAAPDTAPDTAPEFACIDPTPVTADELLMLVPSSFNERNLYVRGSTRTTTDPLTTTSDVDVDIDAIPIPSECDERCELQVDSSVDGVTVDADTISIAAGTSFRVRFHTADVPTIPVPSVVAGVSFIPNCDVPCAADELRCHLDGVCYFNGGPRSNTNVTEQYCVDCAGMNFNECDCITQWAPRETEPNGLECVVCVPWIDICDLGTCQAGTCELD